MKPIFSKILPVLSALLLLTVVAMAQQPVSGEGFIFKGKLVDADSAIAVSFAHVANPMKNRITVSSDEGTFHLAVEAGDTLLISRIGYTTTKYAVPLKEPKGITTILIAPKTEEMQEVVISKFPTEAELKKKLLALELPDDGVKLALPPGRPADRPADGTEGVTIASIPGAVSGFANKFNNKERGRQFKAKIAEQEYREAVIAEKFNRGVVQQITGLKEEEKLDEFMKFCVMPEDFLYKASEYEIHEAVLGCFKDFIASR